MTTFTKGDTVKPSKGKLFESSTKQDGTFAALDEVMALPSLDVAREDIATMVEEVRVAIDEAIGKQEWDEPDSTWNRSECTGDYTLLDGACGIIMLRSSSPVSREYMSAVRAAVEPIGRAHGFTRISRDPDTYGAPVIGLASISGEFTTALGKRCIAVVASTGCRLTDEQKQWVRETGLPYAPDDEWQRGRWPFKVPDPSRYAQTS